jgi:uncharacterized CHY-type Zn-finger protein
VQVYGKPVDEQTRCVHYRTRKDVIAVKFRCCARYYPCFLCHEECADHPAMVWPANQWQERAILCGVCRTELTIADYRASKRCPSCAAEFNEACSNHAHLYFAVSSPDEISDSSDSSPRAAMASPTASAVRISPTITGTTII